MRIKAVSIENVFETDSAGAVLETTIDLHAGAARGAAPADWIADVASLALDDSVAETVRESFDVARGALCYAYWYAPLLTTTTHDMLRVADFATVEACRVRNVHGHSMNARISALVAKQAIDADDVAAWTMVRRERDAVSHPTSHRIYGFATAYRTIATIRDLINRIAWNP